MSCSGEGFIEDVKLKVICIAVEVGTMMEYDVIKGEHVEDEQERAKPRTGGRLWTEKWCRKCAAINVDELLSVYEIGL